MNFEILPYRILYRPYRIPINNVGSTAPSIFKNLGRVKWVGGIDLILFRFVVYVLIFILFVISQGKWELCRPRRIFLIRRNLGISSGTMAATKFPSYQNFPANIQMDVILWLNCPFPQFFKNRHLKPFWPRWSHDCLVWL